MVQRMLKTVVGVALVVHSVVGHRAQDSKVADELNTARPGRWQPGRFARSEGRKPVERKARPEERLARTVRHGPRPRASWKALMPACPSISRTPTR